jgi:sugar phosphate permease
MNDRIVMPVWTIGLFIIVMNTTMFNVSIPSIIGDLGITADMGSWIISSYSIGYALSTVIYSRLSDVVPIRWLLTVGLTILGLSSIFLEQRNLDDSTKKVDRHRYGAHAVAAVFRRLHLGGGLRAFS